MPEDAEPEDWHDGIWRAWDVLRYDRPYLAMGGEMPVSFASISAYADRYGIAGQDFDEFLMLFRAIDDEWLAICVEREKERQAREDAKRKR
ncbi:MAG: hypothetical protein M9944_08055 [Rhizobiaceae bacterium]|nr:hypothetical protein [Rhizobiaceae bacterium]